MTWTLFRLRDADLDLICIIAPKVASPAQDSPKVSPKRTAGNKTAQDDNTEVDGETAGKKTFGFEMKTKIAVVMSPPKVSQSSGHWTMFQRGI